MRNKLVLFLECSSLCVRIDSLVCFRRRHREWNIYHLVMASGTTVKLNDVRHGQTFGRAIVIKYDNLRPIQAD